MKPGQSSDRLRFIMGIPIPVRRCLFSEWRPRVTTQIATFMGQHGAHLGPVGPIWAPCWPHEPCYQGTMVSGRSSDCPSNSEVTLKTVDSWMTHINKIFSHKTAIQSTAKHRTDLAKLKLKKIYHLLSIIVNMSYSPIFNHALQHNIVGINFFLFPLYRSWNTSTGIITLASWWYEMDGSEISLDSKKEY